MKRTLFLLVTIFALFFSLNKVEAQITNPLDTLTYVNGWRLKSYAEDVHYAGTRFDNTSAYHGRFSQWFWVEQLKENATDAEKYWALFEKKLEKPISVYNASTSPVGAGSIWINYFRTKPTVVGYGEYIRFGIAFGWRGQISDYTWTGSTYLDGPWRWSTFNSPPFDSVDCIYIKLSGNLKNTYIQIDYLYFDRGDMGEPLSIIDDFEDSTIVGVEDELSIPTNYSLSQNYPNPFNPSTTIRYNLSKSAFVTLKVFDVLGREVETLVNEEKSVGEHTVKFNGSHLSSGMYFYQITIGHGQFVQTKKMILMK